MLQSLPACSYTLTLTDANGCVEAQSVEVDETTAVFLQDTVINATAPTASDGAVLVMDVLGGIPPYSYLWSNGSTSKSLENAPSGDYSLTVTDSLGCGYVFGYVVDVGTASNEGGGYGLRATIVPNPSEKKRGAALNKKKPFAQLAQRAFSQNGCTPYFLFALTIICPSSLPALA